MFRPVTVIALICTLFFSARPFEKNPLPTTAQVQGYPNMNLVFPDGSVRSSLNLPPKSILVFYFPDCDHCQREGADIAKHLAAFKNYHVWFITPASFAEIQQFAMVYKLIGFDYVHFVRTEARDITNNYGGIQTPSLYIYSKEKKLVKSFNGETKVEEIIKFL